ncbi:MAG: sigma-54 dependent transcriptional regulator [Pseudomonadota bacterium]
MSSTILVVEDDRQQRRYLSAVLTSAGHRVDAVASSEAAVARLSQQSAPAVDLCLLDLHLPSMDGMTLLRRMRAQGFTIPVIVLTGEGSVTRAVEAMQAGANDFLSKPVGPERLEVSIRNLLAISTLASDVRRLSRQDSTGLAFDDLVAESPAIREAIKLSQRGAQSDIPVLITGESGTGKEVFARAIHGGSTRAERPFVAVNCGALPSNLVESILFGHEKGAFTGATEKRTGKFQEASGGTLFLDEIGELPAEAQVKLLRALQQREVDPVGGRTSIPIDIRLVSASNQDLPAMVAEGRFREDLYYRISAFPVALPALRDRREDVLMLARMFLTRFAAAENARVSGLHEEAARMIEGADWPGNVRQLQNTIHRAVVLCDGPQIRPEHLIGLDISTVGGADYAAEAARDALVDEHGQIRKLADIEAEAIERALTIYHGRMAEVARRLGIGRSTLYRKLEELNLSRKHA